MFCCFFLTNQLQQSLGDMQIVLCHVFSSPSPAKVKIKARSSSQPEEGSLLTAAPGRVESSFISLRNLTFVGLKEFNKDPRPLAACNPSHS